MELKDRYLLDSFIQLFETMGIGSGGMVPVHSFVMDVHGCGQEPIPYIALDHKSRFVECSVEAVGFKDIRSQADRCAENFAAGAGCLQNRERAPFRSARYKMQIRRVIQKIERCSVENIGGIIICLTFFAHKAERDV